MQRKNAVKLGVACGLATFLFLAFVLLATGLPTEAAGLRRVDIEPAGLSHLAESSSYRPLMVALGDEPQSLDIHVGGALFDSLIVLNQLMEPPFHYRPDGSLEPAGATTYTASPDGLHYTVTLRTDAVWSDGLPVTAQHYEDGVIRLLDPATNAGYAFLMHILEGGEDYNTGVITDPSLVGVEAIGVHTLVFTLEQAAGYFPNALATSAAYPVRLDLIASDPDWTEGGHFVGNGPYVLTEWDHGTRLVLDQNPLYYDAEEVSIYQLIFKIITDPLSRIAAYRNGELDVIHDPDLEQVWPDPILSGELRRTPRLGVYYLGMNTALTPTSDITVRQALASAIDRSYIVTDILGMPWREPATSVIPPGVQGYQNGAVGYTFDVTQAQAYLSAAGYPGGAGFPGVELWANFGNENVIDAVADQWRTNLGISVTTFYTVYGEYLGLLDGCHPDPGSCNYNAYRLGWVMDYADPNNLLNDVFHPDSSAQHTGWDDARYRQLIGMTLTETNQILRRDYFQEADQILVEQEVAVIPIWFYDQQTLIAPDISYEYPPVGTPYFMNWELGVPPRILRVGMGGDPSIDPTNITLASFPLLSQVMEPPFEYAPDGGLEPAGAVTYTVSPDGYVYTVTLRADALWHDGVEVTAQHYADGIFRILEPGSGGYPFMLSVVEGADDYNAGVISDTEAVGVTAVDDETLVFTLAQPAGFFPSILATAALYPARLDVIGAHPSDWTEPGNFVGNGPYALTEWTHDDLVVVRSHWRYHNYSQVTVEEIEFYILDEDDQLVAYENDLLDVSEVPDSEIARILADPVLSNEFYRRSRPGVYYLGMNTVLSATDSLLVRQALASAIDRSYILTDVLGTPWAEPATSVIPPSVNGYQNGAVGYTYNVAQAQAYLAAAGYPGGAGFPAVELWANHGNEAVIDTVAAQWRTNLSISVTTFYTDWAPYTGLLGGCPGGGGCSYNAYRMGWVLDYPDANNILNDLFHPDSPRMYTGWDSARYRQLISMTLTETNQVSRTTYFQEADRILVEDDVAIVPIYFYDYQNLVKSDVLPEFVPFYGPHYKNWRLTTTVTETISAGGGTISAPDGDVDVEFPPGAVPGTAIVTFTSFYVSPHPPTGTFSFAGNAFQLEVTDLGSGDSITQFTEPLTITIYYNDGDLNGIDEGTLELMYWNGSEWVTDGITVVLHDTVNNILIIQIDHLTELALFGVRRVYLPAIMRNW